MKLGIFELDTIYNEDCYKAIKDIPDKSIDCIYVDIPYLYNQGSCGSSELGERLGKRKMELMGCRDVYEQNKNTKRSEALRIAKNNKQQSINIISIEDGIDYGILNDFVRVMKKINCFIWCSKLQIFEIMKFFLEELKTRDEYRNTKIFFETLVWCKTNPTPTTNNSWLPDVEYCLYFREEGIKYNSGYDIKSKCYISPANVKDKDKFLHPTIKPIEFVRRHLLHTTQPSDIVLDCFLGSGTIAVVCKDIGRHYIGFEIDKKWFDIAQNRLNCMDSSGQLSLFLK